MSIKFADIAGAKVGRACDLAAHGFEYCRAAAARAQRTELIEDLFPIAFIAIVTLIVFAALIIAHRRSVRGTMQAGGYALTATQSRPVRRATLGIGG